ncbi:MAG TPA: glycine oxidase ThiO [Acidimicrobiales bacterium]|jgi:glycine oxidase|nr:glycine oxidase ThiO [Acidimicrobiales bacterium]
MPDSDLLDAVVVGGGVIGLSIAWRAAAAGLAVAVVDPRPGHGATWAAAGMLGPVGEAHFGEEALARANVAAAHRWPDFAGDLEAFSDRTVGYRRSGTVLAAVDPSDRRVVDDVLGYQQSLGLSPRRLSSRECRELEPLLAPGIGGGAEFPDDHQVDNRLLVDSLLAACRHAGVTRVTDDVSAVASTDGRATGVVLGRGGTIHAGAVVIAAGCWSGQLGGIPHPLVPPVRPVKGLTIRARASGGTPQLRRIVRGLVHGRSCYLVPRQDGTVVIGATVEEKGFDLAVQVGSVHDLLRDARAVVPALDEYELVETSTGLRPGSPDNAPLVGTTSMGGLIMATGHYRNGILLAPVTADAVVALLEGRPVDDFMLPFGPDRFAPAAGVGGPGRTRVRT